MNKAKCKNCNDVIQSKSNHDFITCSCFKNCETNKGIFLDGGDEYYRYGGCIENLEWVYE